MKVCSQSGQLMNSDRKSGQWACLTKPFPYRWPSPVDFCLSTDKQKSTGDKEFNVVQRHHAEGNEKY